MKKIPSHFLYLGEVGTCCAESLGTSTKSWRFQSRSSLGSCSLCRSVRSLVAWYVAAIFLGGKGGRYRGVTGLWIYVENGRWKNKNQTLRELWDGKENSHLERTLVLMLITTSAWIYFRDFDSSLPLKPSLFREDAVETVLIFIPSIRDSWFCFRFGFRSMPPPRRLFFVFLLAAFLSRGIEDQLELGTFLSFPRRCIALYFPMPSISIPTFRPRRFPSLSKPRGAVFVRTCCDFTSPSTLTIWRWSIEATRNLQKDFDIGGHRLVK